MFVNDETGETSKDKPMILEFAEKVMNIDQGDSDKNALHKATSKARDAETAKRKMEVTVNETRAEIMNLKALLKHWTTASVEIFHEMQTFDGAMNTIYDNVMNRLPDFQQYNNKIEQHKSKADHAAERIEVSRRMGKYQSNTATHPQTQPFLRLASLTLAQLALTSLARRPRTMSFRSSISRSLPSTGRSTLCRRRTRP